jgi:arylsulfatase A-like enzyme
MTGIDPGIDMNQVVGTHDIVLITLDTLRYDVAQAAFERGELPVLARRLPARGWEKRHTPGSFTYAAHHAFFAGYLPTPARPGRHPRLFASAFRGSETTARGTFVFDQDNLAHGLRARGYRGVCIGGVGFFNKRNALGAVLPGLFDESHWSPGLGVGHRRSTERQVGLAVRRMRAITQRLFLFINVSAIHTPNHMYLAGQSRDSIDSHAAALRYVDGVLAPLFDAIEARGPAFVIVCSDHGTAYGDDGYDGHRVAHECVWTVPYAHFFIGREPC